MTQEAKKSSNTHSDKKHQDSERVHGMREGVENFKRNADQINNKAAAGINMCSENMGALLNSGTAASRCCMTISNEIIENCNRTAAEFSEISREALACRTINDVMDLQTRCIEQLSNSYFDMANKLSGMAFDAWAEALAPVIRRADTSSKQMRKAA